MTMNVLIDVLLVIGAYLTYRELFYAPLPDEPMPDLREARLRGIA